MKSLYKIHFIVFSILWVLSYFAYPFSEFAGIDERISNFILFSLLLLVNLVFLLTSLTVFNVNDKVESPSLTFSIVLFIFFLQFIISFLLNTPAEWLPTFSRYLLYITSFIIFYFGFKNRIIKISNLSVVVSILSIILIFSGFYELLSGNVRYVNGAYRVAGNFTDHHLGFALACFVNINYLQFISFKKFNFLRYLLLFLLVIVFVFSHSRLLLISLIFSSFCIRFYLHKRIIIKISYIFSGLLFCLLFLGIVLYTDLLPRMRDLFVIGGMDASSLYRVFIVQESIMNLNLLEYLSGIGMGGFNEFFFKATGHSGVAAHNDYLLMLVEGGLLSLLLYFIYQYRVLMHVLKSDLKNINLIKLTFVLFFGIEVFGFLQNAHYFYQSELLVFISLSLFYASTQQEDSLLSTK